MRPRARLRQMRKDCPRKCSCSAAVTVLLSLVVCSTAQQSGEFIELRSMRIALNKASLFPLSTQGTGTAPPPHGAPPPSAASAAGATASGSGGAAGSAAEAAKPFLTRYVSGSPCSSAQALRDTLVVSAQARFLEYVGNNTYLIFGNQDSIVRAARKCGALLAEYAATAKVSPETARVLSDAKVAEQLQSNRRRALAEAAAAVDGTSSSMSSGSAAARGLLQSSPSPQGSSPPASGSSIAGSTASGAPFTGALASLQTWDTLVRAQGDSADGNSGSGGGDVRDSSGAGGLGNSARQSGASSGSDLYGFSVRLVAEAPSEALVAAFSQWPAELTEALNRSAGDHCRPRFLDAGVLATSSASSGTLHVYLCVEDINDGIEWLANQTLVLWTEPLLRATTSNAVAGWILQTGNLTQSQFSNPVSSTRPYWMAGLRGQGTVIGAGDTGIDMSQCYFIDEDYRPGSLRTMFVGNPPRLSLPYHRKILQYMLPERTTLKWFGDEPGGHGTSVIGSLAGSILDSNGNVKSDNGTGAAPMARISFFDYKREGVMGGLFIPRPIDDKVLPYHYEVGARLSAETWTLQSSLANKYTEDSRRYDTFMWRHPEYLSVAAAGNFGANRGMVSVVAPATAKNVLTVGASINNPKDTTTSSYNFALLFQYRDANSVLVQQPVWPALGSGFNQWRSMINAAIPVRLANPEHACTKLIGNFSGSVVLVDVLAQDCPFSTRGAMAAAAGAKAVLFITHTDGFAEETNLANKTLPVNIIFGFIGRIQGLNIRTVLRTATAATSPALTSQSFPGVNYGIDSLLWFSSAGPLSDGRIKPDIVAPGGMVSSANAGVFSNEANGDTCRGDVSANQGTSTAAALATGHLALVQQYFRDGYYPSGSIGALESAPFMPSGMLIKAAAIAGADALVGGVATSTGRVFGQGPDGFKGWGRLDLSGALPLPGLTAPNFRIQVADYGTIGNGEYIYLRGLRATGTGPVYAALVWNDYPSSGSATKDLVNDLDFGFQLNTPNNSLVYSRTRADSTNNVERVELTNLKASDNITLVVQGRTIRHQLLTGPDAQLPQRWAVFVAGHFTGTLKTMLNPAFAKPQRILQDVRSSRLSIRLQNGECVTVTNGTNVATSTTGCNAPSSIFTLNEILDNTTGGFSYNIRDSQGRCWAVNGLVTGVTRVVLNACSAGAKSQQMAVFRNPFVSGSFLIVPQPALGTSPDTRRCLSRTFLASLNQNVLVLAACDEDSALQNFSVESPASVPPSPPLPPPSPAPPVPSPSKAPEEQWYPYPLLFRTDFFPINGSQNTFDYDYSDYTDTSALSQLDIVVSWTWAKLVYQIALDPKLVINSPTGVVHDGDNDYELTMFESVHWENGVLPPPTTYNVCVSWGKTQTPSVKVILNVYQGYAVAAFRKVFNTSRPFSVSQCNASSPGFVASYNYTAAASPSGQLPPVDSLAPPPPMALSNRPLVFRADWTPISGYVGRQNQLVDLDLIIAWNDTANGYSELDFYNPRSGGGAYGGDNIINARNYEFSYWPEGSTPPKATLCACVRWFGKKRPLTQVTFTVFLFDDVIQEMVLTLDTTYDRPGVCNPSVLGYLGSLDMSSGLQYPPPPAPQPPPAPPGCLDPVAPSNMFALYFRTQWWPLQGTAASSTTSLDLDMVVAWSYNSDFQELSRYNRLRGGGVHGGDNMEAGNVVNGEVAYWPSGLTGIPPATADYHVCVRWFTQGPLNVTLTVTLGETIVKVASRSVSTTDMNGKYCLPGTSGYISTYSYRPVSNSSSSASSRLSPFAASEISWDFSLPDSLSSGWSSGQTNGGAASTASDNASSKDSVGPSGVSTDGLSPPPAVQVQDFGGGGSAAPPSSIRVGSSTPPPLAPQVNSVENSGVASASEQLQAADGKGGGVNVLGLVLGTVIGTIALVALTALAVRWRRSRLRNTRVVDMSDLTKPKEGWANSRPL